MLTPRAELLFFPMKLLTIGLKLLTFLEFTHYPCLIAHSSTKFARFPSGIAHFWPRVDRKFYIEKKS